MPSPVNIVLVHGAWCDGSSWSEVIPLLQAAGHRVLAVQLPATGLADDIATTRHALAFLSGPTVLVGHSYGGAVISGAGADAPNVKSLVFVAAYALDEGETLSDINNRFAATEGVQHIRPTYAENAVWIDPDAFPTFFAPDIDPAKARTLAAVQKPQAGRAFDEKSGPAAWRTLPSWYLVSANDQIINPDAERWLAERMNATTLSLASGHASPLSHPQEVADAIFAAAQHAATA